MGEEKETSEINGMTVHVLPTKKFKTIQIVMKFRAPLDKNTITKRALLPYILRKGSRKYSSEKTLQTKLDQLYGAVLVTDGAKKGNNHILSVRLEVPNEKYISSASNILNEGIELLNEIIFNPLVDDNGFDETIFSREKKSLRKRIEAIIDNKMGYANLRLIDEMCSEEKYGLRVHGNEKDLEQLNRSGHYSYYKQMLLNDVCDLYVVGDVSSSEVLSEIEKVFPDLSTTTKHSWSEPEEHVAKEIKEVIEKQDVQQAKLHIGYRTHCTYKDDNYFALQVFNGLFGGFPNSKLFMNVREKHSLAYYAASRLESLKGLLIVVSGIDNSDYKKARTIIEEQLTAMQNGEFTEEMLEETKEMLINQFLESLDNISGMIEMNYHQVLGDSTWQLNSFSEHIKKVTKEEVIETAKNIKEDTVYLLTSGGNSDA